MNTFSHQLFRYRFEKAMISLLYLAAIINIAALFGVCFFLIYNGSSSISWDFLTLPPRNSMTTGGILPCLLGTAGLAFGSIALAFPFGVISAIYLHEYAGKARMAKYIRLGVNNLAGVPSIVFGLFGMSFFVIFCELQVSLLSGILTLAIVILPVIISTSEEALRQVPNMYKEASIALGATQSQTIWHVVLPVAFPNMLTGAILGLSRAAGETAVIMFTAAVFFTPKTDIALMQPVMALPNHIYVLATAGTEIDKTLPIQYGTSLVLFVLVFAMSAGAIWLRDRMQKKY